MTAGESRERQLGRFDRDLLTFWLSWAPYGGPPADECFVEFGMAIERVRECCMQVVCTARAADYGDTERSLLLRASRQLLGRPTRLTPVPVVRNPANVVPRQRLAVVR